MLAPVCSLGRLEQAEIKHLFAGVSQGATASSGCGVHGLLFCSQVVCGYTSLFALPPSFPPDGEVWEWSEGVSHLLQSQRHLLSADIQQCLLSLGAAQSVVTRILQDPSDQGCRIVSLSQSCVGVERTVFMSTLAAAKENGAVDAVP